MITSQELRTKFLEFFRSKNHIIIPSSSLIPENDPSTLFTTAGMQPLVPYLLGEPHPLGRRLANVQKSLRTTDIDEVGDNWHLSFFEMLGNWSLGDYFKKEAIEWSFEFLTSPEWLGLALDHLAVTVFSGNEFAPQDKEAIEMWQSLGIKKQRIASLGIEDNWWPPGKDSTGPQGPTTEMFYWTADSPPPLEFDPTDNRWAEIWNDVFMQFTRQTKGADLLPLKQKNVDTGMGLERTVAVLNKKGSVYETDVFESLIRKLQTLVKRQEERGQRIIVDHLRAATFIIADDFGVTPSNLDRGYVARRLIRRAIRQGKRLGISENFTTQIAQQVINLMKEIYTELDRNKSKVFKALQEEEEKFNQTLSKGTREFEKLVSLAQNKIITGRQAFNLFATYGFPLEVTIDLASERGFQVDEAGFAEEFKKHQEKSRTATVGKFRGGLVDHSPATIKLHTANHLLQAALRRVLGDHVKQRGSNITHERLRFDFTHSERLTAQQLKEVEDLVNQAIAKDYPVSWQEMTVTEAKKSGALGFFEGQYEEKVKVYTIGNPDYPPTGDPTAPTFSKEICGGPHVEKTSILGKFKIIKEEAVSTGIRRIKAVLI